MAIQPTKAQFAEAKAAFEAQGGRTFSGSILELPGSTWEERFEFNFNDATDADLCALPPVPFAFDLDLSCSTQVTDAGLKHIGKFAKLDMLDVSAQNVRRLPGTHITDVGLQEVAKLKKLRMLNLCAADITHEGLKDLARLKGLVTLNLGWTRLNIALPLLQSPAPGTREEETVTIDSAI